MQHDEVVTIPFTANKCTNCPGIVFNLVTIDGVKFVRCLSCGTFMLIIQSHKVT